MIIGKVQTIAIIAFICFTLSGSIGIAQPNVYVSEQAFMIPGLNRERHIRVYLPLNYKESKQAYPVLYMHDGQNLFDDSTSFSGEWGVDESLNELDSALNFNMIVVGIDNSSDNRMNEYSAWQNRAFGEAEGKEYVEFIVKNIKPYIDSAYRTLPARENTAIMGSSMGGLITHYAIYEYPEVFGMAGIFSPSYWFADAAYDYTLAKPIRKDARLYFTVGKKEGDMMVHGSELMYEYIVKSGHPKQQINLIIDENGEHNEAFWRQQFTPAIKWLFKL